MGFWIRHFVLILLVVVAPIGWGLWQDTEAEVERAKAAGIAQVRREVRVLSSEIASRVRAHVDEALAAAHALEDSGVLEQRGRRGGAELLEDASARLESILPEGGFAWLVDETGQVVAGDSRSSPRAIGGHPLFVATQLGLAGDMLWRRSEPLTWAAAAPLVVDGKARGAVVVGWSLDQGFVSKLAEELNVGLTLLDGDTPQLSSLSEEQVEALGDVLAAEDPSVGGSRAEALPAPVPGLPLMVGPHAEGLGFAVSSLGVPGVNLRWAVSVPVSDAFSPLAMRQARLLGLGLALALVVLVFALWTHRAYVRPIGVISDHLSDIQLGRGEVELAEFRVSRPFRRLVRLINMTVQKLPSRGLATLSGTSRPVAAVKAPTVPPSAPAPVAAPSRVEPKVAPAAPVAASEAPLPAPPLTEPPAPVSDPNDDIAAAIAALGAPPPPAAPSAASRKSAAEIRGGTPGSMSAMDDEFYEISQFTVRPNPRAASQAAPASGPRMGGSLDLGQAAGITREGASEKKAQATVVAPVAEELLAQSAREDGEIENEGVQPDMTVVANVDPKLLSQTLEAPSGDLEGLEPADLEHFQEVYDRFVAMRKQCGERTSDIAFERFSKKLLKNRSKLVEKYNCKTVRFQVYEKDGKAALKATPVRAR